jgi:endoglucanase
MNEPNTMSTDLWVADANTAIAAIRATGAKNLILVPGNAWTGAWTWLSSSYGTPNGTALLGVVDPANNFAFEVHQYLDTNGSGGNMGACVSSTIGSQRLAAFTTWLTQHGYKGFLGEFGAGTNSTCLAALDDLVKHMETHPQQWLGWTYWAAGPWWGTSVSAIEPNPDGSDKPQTLKLMPYLR